MHSKAEEKTRNAAFKRNVRLENLLTLLNQNLACAEEKLLEKSSVHGPDHPLIFIMGPLRSGTTLFMQWLANSKLVAYPSNLLSRFYAAPAIGAQIQLLLTDPSFNFRDEILDFNNSISFDSANGKTRGALAPNEFWYFWRRFLPFQDLDWLPDEELFHIVDLEKLTSELTTLTRIFGKPFALKGMILNYNIPFLNTIFEKALFIQIERDPLTNIASILEARERQLGSEKEWYSFKIAEYPQLKDLDPITQTAGQLHYINAAVEKGMATVSESRKLIVKYEEFCQAPHKVYKDLLAKLELPENNNHYDGPRQFTPSRKDGILNIEKIEEAMSSFVDKKTAL